MDKRFLFIPVGEPVHIPFEYNGQQGELVAPPEGIGLKVGITYDVVQPWFAERGLTVELLDELVVAPGKGKWIEQGTPAAKLKAMGEKPVIGKSK